jgi:hypothetical protein
MKTQTRMSAVVGLGLVSAVAGAYSVTAIYREGNLLAWGSRSSCHSPRSP